MSIIDRFAGSAIAEEYDRIAAAIQWSRRRITGKSA